MSYMYYAKCIIFKRRGCAFLISMFRFRMAVEPKKYSQSEVLEIKLEVGVLTLNIK